MDNTTIYNTNKDCSICYYNINAHKVLTDCGHEFCFNCFITTIQYDNGFRCPICRKNWEVEYDDEENEK